MIHARLSPSGAHRWMLCPGSPVLESIVPDTSSVYADEGTAAHTLLSWALLEGKPAAYRLDNEIKGGDRLFPVTKEMAGYVQNVVDYVCDLADDGCLILVDQQVPVGHLTGEAGATGTADVVILDLKRRVIIVIDFKYGMGVRVDAPENPQLRHYGLGALERYGVVADFDFAELVIHQPRLGHISTETISVDDLLDYGVEIGEAAARVADAAVVQSLVDGDFMAYLNPGEEQCRFCRAKSTCPALAAAVVEASSSGACSVSEFASLFPIIPDADLPEDRLAVSMDKVDLIEDWCKAVRAEVQRRLLIGQQVPGYKLVTGKMGDRKWIDAERAEKCMREFKVKVDDMFDRKLISPTTAEKLLKTRPSAWDALQKSITRAPGKPSVAPATDPRPALAITDVAEEFRALANEE